MALVPFPSQGTSPVPSDPDWDDLEPSEDGGRMSFLEHLDELRRRLIYSFAAIFIGFVVMFTVSPWLEALVMQPIHDMLPDGRTLIFIQPAEMFLLRLKISAIAGLLLASPFVMTQIWLFVAPGLYTHEKKLAIPFVVLTSFFFVLGAFFSHQIVFPISFQFFLGFETELVRAEIRVTDAFSLWAKLLFACALAFQMPTVVLFLAKMGVVTPGFLMRQFRYAVLLIFVVSAVITPPDIVSQVLLAFPMIGLYMLSVGLAWLVHRKKRQRGDAEEREDDE
jgi:sec-independent protein translocase protein TatC